MQNAKSNMGLSAIFLILSILLVVLCYCKWSWLDYIRPELNTIGISLFVTSIVYFVMYYGEYKRTYFSYLAKVCHENNKLADYLTDFVFDCQHSDNLTFKIERIIKLYEQIHALDKIAVDLLVIKIYGKRKEAFQLAFHQNSKIYVELIDEIVERRNKAVEVLNQLNKSQNSAYKRAANDFLNETVMFAKKYSTLFLANLKDIRESAHFDVLYETKYQTSFK